MEIYLIFLIALINILVLYFNLCKVPKIVHPDISELPPPIPKLCSASNKGDFHRITCYEHCKIVDIETYHTSTFGCNGFKLDLQLELCFSGAKIEVIYKDSHNRRFRIFNPNNLSQSIELLGSWTNKSCGCNVWRWRVVGDSSIYIEKYNRDLY